MGLSDAAFAGHVFWDAETWMFPALVLQHPDLAKSMLEYRFRTLPGAIANAKAEGKQGATLRLGERRDGKRTDTAGHAASRHGRHVTGDIALAFQQYWLATGDRDLAGDAGVAGALRDRGLLGQSRHAGGGWGFGILKVATPDENAGLSSTTARGRTTSPRRNLEFAADTARSWDERPTPGGQDRCLA